MYEDNLTALEIVDPFTNERIKNALREITQSLNDEISLTSFV